MLYTKTQSVEAIKNIAHALGDLNEKVVSVGGAVSGLYMDDPGAIEPRPTKDVDIVLEIASVLELEDLREQLAKCGINFAKDEKVMCRFTYQKILLDVMATKEIGWAPSNPWFKSGCEHPEIIYLDNVKIKIMHLAHYLASKFAAFKERGNDPRISHDFEDIVYVLDNSQNLADDILVSKENVKKFLLFEFKTILDDPSFQEAVVAHLEPSTQTQRFGMLNQKLKEMLG